jgi:hypothetical protein
VCQGETEAGAVGAGGALGPVEAVEDVGDLAFRYTAAVVGDAYGYTPILSGEP